ncbi:putative RNA recognition motif domain, nucleotide-binding alpha-beta plait domain superfamily [Helianthus annuus]|nr:putative RNA recognition motif domain, nucleotide-binding alpha-beta plait domain superfamily [Helianthus annuus]
MDHRRRIPIPENVECRITKLFVTNLPEGCSGTDLASHVRPFGQIFDLYIARKRDKGGNRFGFISMLDVKDKDELIKSLRNTRIGKYKLWFSIARFVLEDGEISNHQPDKSNSNKFGTKNNKVDDSHVDANKGTFASGKKSFKDMLVGKTVTVNIRVNAFQSLHGKALVARMIDLRALKNIKIILNDICPGRGRVQYLGGLDVMVSFDDAETVVAVREAAKLVVGKFSMISIWEGQTLGFERLAWLKVQGIPLHLLSNEVIDAVGGVFGKVVHKANRSERDHDLSFEYVGVLVGDGKRVSEEVVLNWKDRRFRVWVMEELGGWMPEFTEEKTHHVVEASETGDDESDDSEDDQSPEVEPEKTNNSGEEVNVHVDPVVLENIGCNNDCNYGNHSRPLNDPVVNSVRDTKEFTPAVNFPFDQFLKENNCPTVSKMKKRKKKI